MPVRPRGNARECWESWCAAHHVGRAVLGASLASWAGLCAFAAVTIPLKYPFDARGQVVDSGVVVGVLVPIAVLNVLLDEGPPELVRASARPLGRERIALATVLLVLVAALSWAVARTAALPTGLVCCDALMLQSLTVSGAALFGGRRGWVLAAAAAAAMSAPGLVPWELDVAYHRDVASGYAAAVALAAVTSTGLYAVRGASGLRSR